HIPRRQRSILIPYTTLFRSKRFGKIPGVTDKNYITNSYHVHVSEQIDAFTKLKFEAEFQNLSPGGAISYVEVPNMQDNIPAVLRSEEHTSELQSRFDLVCRL